MIGRDFWGGREYKGAGQQLSKKRDQDNVCRRTGTNVCKKEIQFSKGEDVQGAKHITQCSKGNI